MFNLPRLHTYMSLSALTNGTRVFENDRCARTETHQEEQHAAVKMFSADRPNTWQTMWAVPSRCWSVCSGTKRLVVHRNGTNFFSQLIWAAPFTWRPITMFLSVTGLKARPIQMHEAGSPGLSHMMSTVPGPWAIIVSCFHSTRVGCSASAAANSSALRSADCGTRAVDVERAPPQCRTDVSVPHRLLSVVGRCYLTAPEFPDPLYSRDNCHQSPAPERVVVSFLIISSKFKEQLHIHIALCREIGFAHVGAAPLGDRPC